MRLGDIDNDVLGLRMLLLVAFAIVARRLWVLRVKAFGQWQPGLWALRLGLSVIVAWGLRALPFRASGDVHSGLLVMFYWGLWALRLRDLRHGCLGTFGVATQGFARCLRCFGPETAGL